MDFKNFIKFSGFFYNLNPLYMNEILKESQDPMLVQKGNELITPGSNVLVPYGDFDKEDDTGETGQFRSPKSGFERDAPALHAYTTANPENMASAIIFVLLTVRADFLQVMQDFPVIMLRLFTKFGDRNEDNPLVGTPKGGEGEWNKDIAQLHTNLARQSDPSNLDDSGFLKGYSLTGTAFGYKMKGIPEVWSNRRTIYDNVMKFMDRNNPDTVGCFKYFIDNITGLKATKAGFCVQIMFGKLGCIDMHNLNLYSAYAKLHNKRKLYRDLDPKKVLGSQAKSTEHYLSVLEQLEKEGANTVKLWDIWVNYVAHNYNSKDATGQSIAGKSRYATTGPYAGITVDPNDPLIQKMSPLQDIPDRYSGKDTRFSTGLHAGGGTASRDHRLISQIRNTQYWHDVLAAAQAQSEKDVPPEVRFKQKQKTDLPYKALAYIASNPEMAQEIGLGQEYIQKAREVLEKEGLLIGPNWSPKGSPGQQTFDFFKPQAKKDIVPKRIKKDKKFDVNRGGKNPKPKNSKTTQKSLF